MNLPLVPLIHAPRTPIAAAMVLVMLAGNAGAAVINVPADQPTVQAAIDAAVNGDVIVIAPGRYVEKIHLKGKAITVRGAMNAEDTILDGGGTPGFVVQIRNGEGPKTIIENLTITGAKGINNANIGSGVYILNTSPTLRRLIIMDNHAGPAYGGGVYIKGGAASLHQVSFTGNSALTGGNVYIESSHATIKESLFMHGNAQNGGGYAVLGGKATLHDSWFESNMANSLGGAIYVAHASLDMKNLTVRDNGKVESCGYYCVTYSPLAGGAIYASGTSGTIRDSVLENNSGAFGGAVYVAGFGSSPHFVNCVIAHNRGGTGAVYCNDSSPKFINSTIFKNTYGGVFTSSSARPTMTNSIIAGHDLPDSAGVDIYGSGKTTVSYSLIQGLAFNETINGPGVFRANPKLDANYVPLPTSPVIDAGNSAAVPSGVTTDVYGRPRFVDDPFTPDTGLGFPVVDLGAVEFQPGGASVICSADIDRSGFVDTDDYDAYIMLYVMGADAADFDNSGFVDTDDLDAFVRAFESGC